MENNTKPQGNSAKKLISGDNLSNSEVYKSLQPNWKNEPNYTQLKQDLDNSNTVRNQWREKLKQWELARDGGKEIIPSKPGKSVYRPKIIRKQNEWKYSALEEPFLNTQDMFDLMPRTAEDVEAARQNALLLNYQWSTKINKVKLIGDIVRTFVDEGTVIVKTAWRTKYAMGTIEKIVPIYATEEESAQLLSMQVDAGDVTEAQAVAMMETGELVQIGEEKQYIKQKFLVENHPTYEVCNNSYVVIDPQCEGIISDAKFIIHEFPVSMAELKQKEYKEYREIVEETVEEQDEISGELVSKKVKVEKVRKVGIYKNLSEISQSNDTYWDDTYESESSRNSNNQGRRDNRVKIKAFEYWGYWDIHGTGEEVAIVVTCVGDTIIRMEESPFPHGRFPFSVATYMPVKKEFYGEPDAEILEQNQDSIGRMMRAAHDITAETAVGQEYIDESFFSSPVEEENHKKGRTVKFREGMDPNRSIKRKSIESVPDTVFAMIDKQEMEAQALSGTRDFGIGNGAQALSASATSINSSLDATSKRDLSILRRLSDMLFKDMARLTVSMNQEFVEPEEVYRITNNFVTIRKDDLGGDFDFKINVSTPEKDDIQADRLWKMLQTNQANMDFGLQKILYAKLMRLWKMPEEEEAVLEFEPTPDPMQQQIAMQQLENERLNGELLKKQIEESDSRIHERASRALENETDIERKNADTALKNQQIQESKARENKYISETDTIDQKHIDDVDGVSDARELEKKKQDAEIELTKEELLAKIRNLESKLSSTGSEVKNTTKEVS